MRAKIDTLWTTKTSAGVNKPSHSVWHAVTGHQIRQVVVDRDQASIEHPMHRAAQRDPISHRVRATIGDWSDVRSLDLRTTSAIDDLEASNSTGVLVDGLDSHSECSIAKRSSYEPLNDRPIE